MQHLGMIEEEPEVLGFIPSPATFISPADSRSFWQKYVHEVLVNHLWCVSLPRKRVVRVTDGPNMTIDVYR